MKTKIEFYLEKDGEVLAYFPNEFYNKDKYTRTCYAHIGQHSACVPDYIQGLNKASKEQAKELANELKQIGYIF